MKPSDLVLAPGRIGCWGVQGIVTPWKDVLDVEFSVPEKDCS